MNTEENGVTISTMCYQCHALLDLCPDCLEDRDSRDTEVAHRIVEEGGDYIVINKRPIATAGSLGERNPDSFIQDYPSGHDWTDRDEFLEPITNIADRIYDLETSLIVTSNETVCDSCHLVYNKWTTCPNCN